MTNTTPATQEDELRELLLAEFKRYDGYKNGPVPPDLLYMTDPNYDPLDFLLDKAVAKIVACTERNATEAYKSGYIDRGLEELGGKNG